MTSATTLHMCDACFTDHTEIGIVADGYSLVQSKKDGKYYLLGGEGHKDALLYVFNKKPVPDPDAECREDLTEAETKLAMEWVNETAEEMEEFRLPPDEGYHLIDACAKSAGYKFDMNFSYWLFDRCGRLLEAFEKKQPMQERPKSALIDGKWNYRVVVTDEMSMVSGQKCRTKVYGMYDVYYNDQGQPHSRGATPETMAFEDMASLRSVLEKMQKAIEQPVLTDTDLVCTKAE